MKHTTGFCTVSNASFSDLQVLLHRHRTGAEIHKYAERSRTMAAARRTPVRVRIRMPPIPVVISTLFYSIRLLLARGHGSHRGTGGSRRKRRRRRRKKLQCQQVIHRPAGGAVNRFLSAIMARLVWLANSLFMAATDRRGTRARADVTSLVTSGNRDVIPRCGLGRCQLPRTRTRTRTGVIRNRTWTCSTCTDSPNVISLLHARSQINYINLLWPTNLKAQTRGGFRFIYYFLQETQRARMEYVKFNCKRVRVVRVWENQTNLEEMSRASFKYNLRARN